MTIRQQPRCLYCWHTVDWWNSVTCCEIKLPLDRAHPFSFSRKIGAIKVMARITRRYLCVVQKAVKRWLGLACGIKHGEIAQQLIAAIICREDRLPVRERLKR